MSFRTAKVGELCNLINGKAFKSEDWSESGQPIIRIQNLNDSSKPFNYWAGTLDRQVIVNPENVLLAWSGTPGTSFGAHIWTGPPGILNQHIFRVDLDDRKITKNWYVRAVNYRLDRLIALAHGGVGLKHVTRGMVDNLEIPLPPLDEQRRIAAILDTADEIRAKRRVALAKLDTMAQSVFIEMFGNPITNSKGWPSVLFSEILLRIDSGNSPVCLDRPAQGDEWAVLKLGAITWCEFDPKQNKALPPGHPIDHALEVKPGDLLFSRKNTYELVAACVFVRETPPRLLLPDLIFRLCLNPHAPIKPDFLSHLLINPSKRREIQKLAGGSAGSMPNISKEKLRTVNILVPPLSLQSIFGQIVDTIERQKVAHRAFSSRLDTLFTSLQHRAFRGEL